jgi:hypothetical protein
MSANRSPSLVVLLALACFTASAALAQTTAFTYQGKLTDAGVPANGSFQMEFKLFDSLASGGQVGSTIPDVPVTVADGIFGVMLDFGLNALSGANRWLEIAVRHNSGESYSTLSPREQIASSPYAVRTLSAASADSLSANCVGCVHDSNITSIGGAKVTGAVASATNATNATNSAQLGGVVAPVRPVPACNLEGDAGHGSASRCPSVRSGSMSEDRKARSRNSSTERERKVPTCPPGSHLMSGSSQWRHIASTCRTG